LTPPNLSTNVFQETNFLFLNPLTIERLKRLASSLYVSPYFDNTLAIFIRQAFGYKKKKEKSPANAGLFRG